MKTQRKIATLLALGTFFVVSASVSWGQSLILSYDFAEEPGNQVSTAASSAASGISGGIVDRGAGLGATAAANSISTNGWTMEETDYISFRFTVDTGFSLDLSELFIGTRSSGTGPGFLGLFYSGDNFTGNLYTFVQSGTSFLNSAVDLSGLTGITGSVEFRIIALNTTSAGGGTVGSGGTFRVTNYFDDGDTGGTTFTGTAIPEPSTYAAIFGVLALAGVVIRRRLGGKR